MLTCKSPRKVMLVAHELASRALPKYSGKFSRHDFTLPQLFACLVVKEHQLEDALQRASGVDLDPLADAETVVAGDRVGVRVRVFMPDPAVAKVGAAAIGCAASKKRKVSAMSASRK